MKSYGKPLLATGTLFLLFGGCIIPSGSESVVRYSLNGVDSIHVSGKQVALASKLASDGTPEMEYKGQPSKTVNLTVGDSVSLPVFNGRADYRLDAVTDEVVLFTGDLWYWACTGPFLIHGTVHLALVRKDRGESDNGLE